MDSQRKAIKIMLNDYNFVRPAKDFKRTTLWTNDMSFSDASLACDWRISLPHELAHSDPEAFFKWQVDLGCNVIFHHCYTFNGCAWYPSKLGPVMPSPGNEFMGKVLDKAHNAGLAFHTYFGVAVDIFACATRNDWLVPKSSMFGVGALAPETEWTDLLCRRIEEVLKMYPIDGILFDQFFYGDTQTPGHLEPAPFVEKPFQEIFGKPMPEKAEQISQEETLTYWREVLARQFIRIRDAVKSVRPECIVYVNVPYLEPDAPLWRDHIMMKESDWLFVESSRQELLDWLMSVRQPEQRIVTTIVGMPHMNGECDARNWKNLYEQGFDFFGYAFPDPETLWPAPIYDESLKVIKEAYHAMPG